MEARAHLDRAFAAYEAEGQAHAAARVSAELAEVDFYEGSLLAAIDRMQGALEVLSTGAAGRGHRRGLGPARPG